MRSSSRKESEYDRPGKHGEVLYGDVKLMMKAVPGPRYGTATASHHMPNRAPVIFRRTRSTTSPEDGVCRMRKTTQYGVCFMNKDSSLFRIPVPRRMLKPADSATRLQSAGNDNYRVLRTTGLLGLANKSIDRALQQARLFRVFAGYFESIYGTEFSSSQRTEQ